MRVNDEVSVLCNAVVEDRIRKRQVLRFGDVRPRNGMTMLQQLCDTRKRGFGIYKCLPPLPVINSRTIAHFDQGNPPTVSKHCQKNITTCQQQQPQRDIYHPTSPTNRHRHRNRSPSWSGPAAGAPKPTETPSRSASTNGAATPAAPTAASPPRCLLGASSTCLPSHTRSG
ncbi:hypothetical protein HO173_006885 [Letharia columbiana]|uniref:Uncharacterized protein n=1 Tax=Letharia columbiana TaxID=112416 RepID=A0A8H6FUJ0_9LECA|nr:uncharacterized protein HO173_006885 [Letharia columbiana]KAF6234955.1 hypothetical protein HO173_006885 [Letharia columbiana]